MAVYKKGKDWYIDYYVHGRRKREKIGPNKRLAHRVLEKRKVELAEDKYLDKKKVAKILFKDFARYYLETYAVKKRSFKTSFVSSIKKLVSEFGDFYLSEITPRMIEEYQTKRSESVSPATVNRDLARLKHMFNKAIEWDQAKDNPVIKIKMLRENNRRLRYLTQEQFERLVNRAPSHFKPILIAARHTGMRKGEVLSLKWDQVDFRERFIYLTDTKNGETREIPMNQTLFGTLRAIPKHLHSPYVFHSTRGERYFNIRKLFVQTCKAAGIEDFRFHDLRHTFASHLVMAGVGLYTVKELLGHKDIKMTLRYSHLSASHKRSAVEALDSYSDYGETNKNKKTMIRQ